MKPLTTWKPWHGWPFWAASALLLMLIGTMTETHGWWLAFAVVCVLVFGCLWRLLYTVRGSRDVRFRRWLEEGGL